MTRSGFLETCLVECHLARRSFIVNLSNAELSGGRGSWPESSYAVVACSPTPLSVGPGIR